MSLLPSRNNRNITTCPRGITASLVDAEHETRATELTAIGFNRKAERVLTCGTDRWGALKCKQRVCPTCAAEKARQNALSATLRGAKFTRPCFITLTAGPRGIHALRDGLDSFADALAAWRRKAVVKRYVHGAVGGLEPKHSARQLPLWLVHGHFIVDATADADFDALARAWEHATQGKGRLLLPPKLGADVHDVERAATYLAKHADWSPRPGALPDETLAQLFQSLHGRRLLLRWGTGRAKRGTKPARATSAAHVGRNTGVTPGIPRSSTDAASSEKAVP